RGDDEVVAAGFELLEELGDVGGVLVAVGAVVAEDVGGRGVEGDLERAAASAARLAEDLDALGLQVLDGAVLGAAVDGEELVGGRGRNLVEELRQGLDLVEGEQDERALKLHVVGTSRWSWPGPRAGRCAPRTRWLSWPWPR